MDNYYGLVPRPRSVTAADGFFAVSAAFIECAAEFGETAAVCAAQLTEAGLACASGANGTGTANIRICEDAGVAHGEGYVLVVASDGITIRASRTAGVFYAFQTLRQLVMSAAEWYGCAAEGNGRPAENPVPVRLPCCRIADEPAYEWRGFMLDTSRNFYPASFIKKVIDALAFHKLNRFHWHLTDDQGWRLYVPEYPLLTGIGGFRGDFRAKWVGKTGGFYTDAEVSEIVEYARLRNIIVVPEIETPGHSSSVLAAYPGLGCTGGPYQVEQRFGVFDDVLCAGNDDVFKLYDAVFDTVCRLFPGPYVHIGGDECPRTNWKTCPKCQARMKAEGLRNEDEIQSWMTVRFASMLEKRGKIPVGWDEVLDGTERLGLPESMIVQSWRGIQGGVKASKLGHKVIMSPQTNGCYLDYKNYDDDSEPGWINSATAETSYGFSPIPEGSGIDASFVLGGQGNLWTEVVYASRIAEYMMFPRLCALAECLWLPEREKDFDGFAGRLDCHKKRLETLDLRYYRGKLR
ncbi:beta-N-acetylhexosaminidase [Treponema brennaborense]|uniref:beta-N-acetylhexosaminidase n=1 Tax=Treponema brennaborense (strain DSM 12168 / CIP 105900 / DD5/3) TaxID=906968 RepID=F4LPQ4_TREBD|nr:beta-N-acetylhexosaminidase [Treponema brennaborense]AEE17050.1 Beta-N-acetylhexosaminidase [Treponema brennaborense DSM 12168]